MTIFAPTLLAHVSIIGKCLGSDEDKMWILGLKYSSSWLAVKQERTQELSIYGDGVLQQLAVLVRCPCQERKNGAEHEGTSERNPKIHE